MTEINNISHDSNLVHISITRLGQGRETRYRITNHDTNNDQHQPNDQDRVQVPAANKYTRGKYGHLVKQ
jgi:hypothetical protein